VHLARLRSTSSDRVARGESGGHSGHPFFDGLGYETIRGAADFLDTGANLGY